MAGPHLIVIHGVAHVRDLMSTVLTREGYDVEGIDSLYKGAMRFAEEPAELVLLGLCGDEEHELDLLRTLKADRRAPAVLVTFPASRREVAVRALEHGADGYLLEPFYSAELLRLVRAHLGMKQAPTEERAELPPLIRELAHAVNNPLQVISLVLDEARTPKKQLIEKVRSEVQRIQTVVAHLIEFGDMPAMEIKELDPGPLAEEAVQLAAQNGEHFRFVAGELPKVWADRRGLSAALRALLDAVGRRTENETAHDLEAHVRGESVVFHLSVPRELFRGEKTDALSRVLFVVREDREVLPGLALSRSLFEAQGGSLRIYESGDRVEVEAAVRRASD